MRTEDADVRGSISARTGRSALDAFVVSLRRRLNSHVAAEQPPQPPAEIRQLDASADLPDQFSKAARAAGCSVHDAVDSDLLTVIRRILEAGSARTVFLEPGSHPVLCGERIAAISAGLTDANITVHSKVDDETLFSVDASITGVAAAIAETGSLVCQSGSTISRGSSLIPPVHIAVVGRSQIVPDLCDFFDDLDAQEALPANINLITGPSKTADIEGTLVTGVHGPRHVHVIIA